MRADRVIQIANIVDDADIGFKNPQRGRVYSTLGIAPSVCTMTGGGLQPKILVIKDNDLLQVERAGACEHGHRAVGRERAVSAETEHGEREYRQVRERCQQRLIGGDTAKEEVTLSCASRGRDGAQMLEINGRCANSLTTVGKDSMVINLKKIKYEQSKTKK